MSNLGNLGKLGKLSKFDLADNTISNVTFFWTKIQKPSLKYQSQTEKEFVVDVLVDKATAKAFGKEFPKQKAKEFDKDELLEALSIDSAPYEADEYFKIRMKKKANYKDRETGELVNTPEQYCPKVFLADEDGLLEDVTQTRLIGNGSVGAIQYDVNSNDYGKFAQLKGIRVDNLVVVEAKQGGGYSALGNVKTTVDTPKQTTTVVVDTTEDDDF